MTHGETRLVHGGCQAVLADRKPMILPAESYVFPTQVPGEEEVLARGSVWVEFRRTDGSRFLGQFALGFQSNSVAHGLWASPVDEEIFVAAGGYMYAVDLREPTRTTLIALRPVIQALESAESGMVLAGFHGLLVRDRSGFWESPRLSWEGLRNLEVAESVLTGLGWDMMADEEVPFRIDLRTKVVSGGGYRI